MKLETKSETTNSHTIVFDLYGTLIDEVDGLYDGSEWLLQELYSRGFDLILFSNAENYAQIMEHIPPQVRDYFRTIQGGQFNQQLEKDIRIFDAEVLVDDSPFQRSYVSSLGLCAIDPTETRLYEDDSKIYGFSEKLTQEEKEGWAHDVLNKILEYTNVKT